MQTKICKECKKELPIELFSKQAVIKDGYNTKCKLCVSTIHSQKVSTPIKSLGGEIWLNVDKCGVYKISNLGRCISFKKNKVNGILLKSAMTEDGYLKFSGHSMLPAMGVHRMIAIFFIPNPLDLPQVNHIDGDKLNNNISNLEWVTASYNMLHSYQIGLHKVLLGEECGSAKLTKEQVIEIYNSKDKLMVLSNKYKVSHDAIYKIKKKINWGYLHI